MVQSFTAYKFACKLDESEFRAVTQASYQVLKIIYHSVLIIFVSHHVAKKMN